MALKNLDNGKAGSGTCPKCGTPLLENGKCPRCDGFSSDDGGCEPNLRPHAAIAADAEAPEHAEASGGPAGDWAVLKELSEQVSGDVNGPYLQRRALDDDEDEEASASAESTHEARFRGLQAFLESTISPGGASDGRELG